MRGGTANCTVMVSSKEIPSPITSKPDTLIVMNQPSLDKFQYSVKEGGTIYINSSLVGDVDIRTDLTVIKIPANQMAIQLGSSKVANMLMLGAYIAENDFMNLETAKAALVRVLSEKKHNLIEINEKALAKGNRFFLDFNQG